MCVDVNKSQFTPSKSIDTDDYKNSFLCKNPLTLSHLCNGKVQTNVDDNSKEKNVKGPDDQQWLLQHQDLIEVVMNLETQQKTFYILFQPNV